MILLVASCYLEIGISSSWVGQYDSSKAITYFTCLTSSQEFQKHSLSDEPSGFPFGFDTLYCCCQLFCLSNGERFLNVTVSFHVRFI